MSTDKPYCEVQEFYDKYGATTVEQKIANMERDLGGRSNMYVTNQVTPVTDEQRLAIYEHEWKIAHGFIHPQYA